MHKEKVKKGGAKQELGEDGYPKDWNAVKTDTASMDLIASRSALAHEFITCVLSSRFVEVTRAKHTQFPLGTPPQVILGLSGERDLGIDSVMHLQRKLGYYNDMITRVYTDMGLSREKEYRYYLDGMKEQNIAGAGRQNASLRNSRENTSLDNSSAGNRSEIKMLFVDQNDERRGNDLCKVLVALIL